MLGFWTLAPRDCGLLALPGALGRYLEHLFGPKPHPWTERAHRPPAVPRWAWAELDSTLTAQRAEGAPRPAKVVVGAAAVATPEITAPLHGNTAPRPAIHAGPSPSHSPSPSPSQVETQSSDPSVDFGPPTTASHVPVRSETWAIKPLVLGGLLGGVVAVGGLALFMSDDSPPAQAPAVAQSSAPTPEPGPPGVAPLPPVGPLAPSPSTGDSAVPTDAAGEAGVDPLADAELDEVPMDEASDEGADETEEGEPKRTARKGSAAEANQLIERARKKMFESPSQAYRDAKRAYDMRQSQTALLLMGFAACRLKSESKARFAHRRLRGKGKTEMESACLQKGIDLR